MILSITNIRNILENLNKSHLTEVKVKKKFLYHQSNPKFRDKISKEGLIPQSRSEAWLSDTNIDGKVIFLSTSDDKQKWFDSGYDDDIYKIDTSKFSANYYLDPNFEWTNTDHYIITYEKIPKNAIELIYIGNGNPKD